ncbi:MAG: sugar ABC transporter permease [Alphaproteobacteria bacterium]|nr:sugar ABC transporter permease [Alphaproteobacteria bacterium]
MAIAAAQDRGIRRPRRRRVEATTAYGFVLPLVAIELALVAAPLLLAGYYSLYRVDYFELTRFRGLGNYATVLASPMVLQALGATVIFTVFALALTLGLGFALALRFEADTRRSVVMRAIVLVPYVISMLVGSLLLRWIYSRDGGLSTMALGLAGLPDFAILADPKAAMAALVSNAVWRDSAFAMILLLAGLKAIPLELHAAARVDGAGAWLRFRRITLPLLRVPILITLVRLMIHFVNVLTFALILTGGGPNNATQTMGLAMYRLGFIDFKLGEANALAVLVFVFNVALIACNLALFRHRRAP